MRFQVPQFIEVEDKIFGPLTFKQFIYVAGAIGICVVIFTLLPRFIALLVSTPIAMLGAALAFFKVNERPFVLMIEDFLKFHIGSKLYIWKKDNKQNKNVEMVKDKPLEQLYVPKLSGSKLRDLTFELDVKQQSNPVTKDTL
ncbi:MAG: PrgI family protein [Minisyncoccota bacterium]